MNAFNFFGRAPRSEFWWYMLVNGILMCAILMYEMSSILDAAMNEKVALPMTYIWFAVVTFFPNLSVQFRRLHDAGFSGWWMLLNFVPVVGPIALLVMFCLPSTNGTNAWGLPYGHAAKPGADIFNDKPVENVPEIFKPGNIYGPDKKAPILTAAEKNAARKAEISDYYRTRVMGQKPAEA